MATVDLFKGSTTYNGRKAFIGEAVILGWDYEFGLEGEGTVNLIVGRVSNVNDGNLIVQVFADIDGDDVPEIAPIANPTFDATVDSGGDPTQLTHFHWMWLANANVT